MGNIQAGIFWKPDTVIPEAGTGGGGLQAVLGAHALQNIPAGSERACRAEDVFRML